VSKTVDIEINLLYSKFHIDINPSEADHHDRVVCQTLLKDFVSNKDANIMNHKEKDDLMGEVPISFKVVIINNAHLLSKDAQAALRRSIEKYTMHCRFIFITESLSSLIHPLRSRCFAVRCPLFNESEVSNMILEISRKEGYIFIQKEVCDKIAAASDRNLRRAIMMIQGCC